MSLSTPRDRGCTHSIVIESGPRTWVIPAYVAVTDKDQALGLQVFAESDLLYSANAPFGDKKSAIGSAAGPGVKALAFLMGSPGPHRFHMASVKFPIDIVWVYQGRIARIATANPGDRETWSARGQFVFEVPAGVLSSRRVCVGDHVRMLTPDPAGTGRSASLHALAAEPLTFPGRERLTAQLATEEAAAEAAADGRPQLADPSALIRGMLEYALDTDPEGRAPDPFLDDASWTHNMLTGGATLSYVIDTATLKRWARGAGVPQDQVGSVVQAAVSDRGLLALGDTLQALGIIDSATPTDYGLVVFRRDDEAPAVAVPAPDPVAVARVAETHRTAGRFRADPKMVNDFFRKVSELAQRVYDEGLSSLRMDLDMKDLAYTPYAQINESLGSTGGRLTLQVSRRSSVAPGFHGYYSPGTIQIGIVIPDDEKDWQTSAVQKQVKGTVEHEVIHWQQHMLTFAQNAFKSQPRGLGLDQFTRGGPGKSQRVLPPQPENGNVYVESGGNYAVVTRDKENPWNGQSVSYGELPHAERDVEFYTNMVSDIREFQSSPYGHDIEEAARRGLTPEKLAAMVSRSVQSYLRWAGRKAPRDVNEERWRKYVREFTREVLNTYLPQDAMAGRTPGHALRMHEEKKRQHEERVARDAAYREAEKAAVKKAIESPKMASLLVDLLALAEQYSEKDSASGDKFAARSRTGAMAWFSRVGSPEAMQQFLANIDTEWLALIAENDYDFYKKHLTELPRIQAGSFEPVFIESVLEELQKRILAKQAKDQAQSQTQTGGNP